MGLKTGELPGKIGFFRAEMGQKAPAAFQNIRISLFKIPGVPGVGHGLLPPGEGEEQAQLSRRVAAADALHGPEVAPVHTEEKIEAGIVLLRHLPGPVPGAGDAVPGEDGPGRGIDGVAELLPGDGGGIDEKLAFHTGAASQLPEEELGHGAAADTAVANE